MDSSPDWNRDADARGWQDSRQALVGRTAAVHKPWARTPRPADPSSPVPLDPTGLLSTTEYRARKKELEHGREQPGRALAGEGDKGGIGAAAYGARRLGRRRRRACVNVTVLSSFERTR